MGYKKITGVYLIRNLINQKIYVGSSIDIKQCWNRHRYKLKRALHGNSQLQEDWDNYGQSKYDFSIQELCNDLELLDRETYWVNDYQTMNPDRGYNCILPNDPKIHRKSKTKINLKIIVCINTVSEEVRELNIVQIKESLNIESKSVYKGIRYWMRKSEGKRSIKEWMFIREEDYNMAFDYIGYNRLEEWRKNYIPKEKKVI